MAVKIDRSIDWKEACLDLVGQGDILSHGPNINTIGLPLYAASSEEQYLKSAAVNNPIILSRFGHLLTPMIETLEGALRLPIGHDPRLALPGFHIFNSSKERPFTGGMWHVDEFKHKLLPEPLASYSATLLIGDDTAPYGVEYRSNGGTHLFHHQIGAVTLFASHLPHRIAPIRSLASASSRISLQAHIWTYREHAVAFW